MKNATFQQNKTFNNVAFDRVNSYDSMSHATSQYVMEVRINTEGICKGSNSTYYTNRIEKIDSMLQLDDCD